MKGLALALVVLFVAFVVVYNVDGSWVFSFVESVSALRGDSFFEWVRDSLARFAVNPIVENASFWENALNAIAYVGKLLIYPVELVVAFIKWLVSVVQIAFAFFPTT